MWKDKSVSISKTAEHWGEEAGKWKMGRGVHWLEHSAVQQRINVKVSGDPAIDPYKYFIDKIAEEGMKLPVERCLTLGCGAGDLERNLVTYNLCNRHDGFDLAPEAIRKAREQAAKENIGHISYDVRDINEIELPPNFYDIVFAVSAMHHLSKLEDVFKQVKKTLKAGGYFFLHEFIGPTKFQWTDRQISVINHLLKILPDKYMYMVGDIKSRKPEVVRPTIGQMDAVDPSEAIRSADIMKVLPQYFTIVEKKDLGGTILHMLLEGIAGNFNRDNPQDMKLLNLLFDIEDTFMEIGEISSDFAVIIAK